MTIYISDLTDQYAWVGLGMNSNIHTWAYLVADSQEELVRFAHRISLNPYWIRHATVSYFRIARQARDKAIKNGAIPVSDDTLTLIMSLYRDGTVNKDGDKERWYKPSTHKGE